MSEPPHTDDTMPDLMLVATDLCSKYGFNDGNTPEEIRAYCLEQHRLVVPSYQWHPVLRQLVREHLLPALAQCHAIEVVEIDTSHNPIRAVTVDGQEVDDLAWATDRVLTPASVTVPGPMVLAAMLSGCVMLRDDKSSH